MYILLFVVANACQLHIHHIHLKHTHTLHTAHLVCSPVTMFAADRHGRSVTLPHALLLFVLYSVWVGLYVQYLVVRYRVAIAPRQHRQHSQVRPVLHTSQCLSHIHPWRLSRAIAKLLEIWTTADSGRSLLRSCARKYVYSRLYKLPLYETDRNNASTGGSKAISSA